jgi:hypothetical protein
VKGDKGPCKACKHGEMKHAKGGPCIVAGCDCKGHK